MSSTLFSSFYIVLEEKSRISLTFASPQLFCSSGFCHDFLLVSGFLCLDVGILVFILLRVLGLSWTCGLLSATNVE